MDRLSTLQLALENEEKNDIHTATVSEDVFQSKELGFDLIKVERKLYANGPIAIREAVYERTPIYPCIFSDAEGKVDNVLIEILQYISSVAVCERIYKDELREKESWASSMMSYFNHSKAELVMAYEDYDNLSYRYKNIYFYGKKAPFVISKLEEADLEEERKEDEWYQFEQALERYKNAYSK